MERSIGNIKFQVEKHQLILNIFHPHTLLNEVVRRISSTRKRKKDWQRKGREGKWSELIYICPEIWSSLLHCLVCYLYQFYNFVHVFVFDFVSIIFLCRNAYRNSSGTRLTHGLWLRKARIIYYADKNDQVTCKWTSAVIKAQNAL